MLKQYLLFICVASCLGCSREGSAPLHDQVETLTSEFPRFSEAPQIAKNATAEQLAAAYIGDKVEFGGHVWHCIGLGTRGKDVWRSELLPLDYRTDDPDLRMLRLVLYPSSHPGFYEGAYKWLLSVQRRSDNSWESHGPSQSMGRDGDLTNEMYVAGEVHGVMESFYPNGQIKVRRHFENGTQHGESVGWYESGNIQYKALYRAGVEVEGESFEDKSAPVGS